MVQFLEDVDFGEEQLLQFLTLEGVELDDLDGHCFPCVDEQLLVSSWCAL